MNSYDLAGKRALVTGGGSGIGFAAARLYLKSGAAVELWGRDAGKLDRARRELDGLGEVHAASVDVADGDRVAEAAQALLAGWGGLDILFNCAGHSTRVAPLAQLTPDDWRQAIAINLDSVFHTCRAFVPGMVAQGWGRIVNTTSQAGKDGNPFMAGYVAAKAGVIGLTKAVGFEAAPHGVLVNAVTPGSIWTQNWAAMPAEERAQYEARHPVGRFGRAEEVAALVSWLSGDECSFSTGAVFDVSGGRAGY